MRWFLAILTSLVVTNTALAEGPYVPDRRAVLSRDVDFYGSDLTNIFDTTLEACINACTNDSQCRAFTFNTRSNACFPKSEISDQQPYEGAVSAEIFETAPGVIALSQTRASDLSFLRAGELANALDQAKNIGRTHAGGPWSALEMVKAAQDRRAAGDTLNAMRWTGAALGKADKSDLWLEYARLNRALKATEKNKSLHGRRALKASINAYLRAGSDPARVSALMVMSDLLIENNAGRRALSALRLAESIQPRDDVVTALNNAVAKYGFRISEHTVESDLAQPRICAEFNEPLVKVGVDYAPFVRLPDQRLAVEANNRRICIDGVDHGTRYTITFRKGLPAASGETLARDTDITLYVRDRSPAVRFPGRAYVLPRTPDAGLPIETVNLDTVDLNLQRVSDRNLLRAIQDNYFGQPLSYWQLESFSNDVAESVWRGEASVTNTLNADSTTRLPMGEVIAGLPAGVYALTADLPGADKYDETSATQWFVLSDLGVTTYSGADGLHVFVRSLSNAAIREGAKITLLSRANRVLGTATSDAKGYARFAAGLTRGTGAAAPAMVLLEQDDDFSFLSLTDPAFDLSDRGVEGRPPAPPVDVFLATDRGAYRAGEVIHATALTRGPTATALPDLPVTAILSRPDGVEYKRILSTSDAAGGHVFALPLGDTVPRGTWTLAIKTDTKSAPLATQKLLVEDFLPERIDFDQTLPDGPIQPAAGDPTLTVTARYLFGAPGSGLKVEGQATLRARTDVQGFKDYAFGRYDDRFSPRTEYFSGDSTDGAGVSELMLPLPQSDQKGRPLQIDVTTRVLEGSGRPVERRITHPVASDGPMIGIRSMFDDVVPEGTEAAFQIIGLAPDLTGQDMNVRWTLNRVRTSYQWYNQYGNWEWEPITRRTAVARGDITIGAAPAKVSAPVEWGRYELVVERLNGDYVASSVDFYAGWYAPADASQTPDTLEVSLDKPGYHSGDTATLRVVPRFAGTAVVSVMSNRLIAMKAIPVTEGENLIPLDVTDEWGAGAYVTAAVIRPTDVAAGMNPARALGLSYAKIDPGAKQLSVTLDAPEKTAPNTPLTVGINVDGIAAGDTAHVTLAAVDVGILNITGFDAPDPSTHYFGQRRLGMEIRDIYGRLIDGMNGNMGALRSGGDAGSSTSFQSPPPTEDLVAYFQGPVTIGPDGHAQVTFDMPEFNGTVRLMAIAWSDTAVGQADRDVLVRNPVVVTATLPRFLAPGDTSRLLLEITHVEGPSGRMGLDITSGGIDLSGGQIPSGLTLADGETTRLSIPVTATSIGDFKLRVALTTPDGKQMVKSLTLPVRANDPEISTTHRLTLAAGDTFTLDNNLFADFRPGTGSAVMSAGALAHFDAPGLLQALDRYPYGCTEQITSKALPLLYFDTISSALGLGNRTRIKDRVDQSIARVLTRQSANGAFGLWYPDSGDFWLDSYVSDFLSRARTKGYAVPDKAFRAALDNLRNRINYAPDFDSGGGDIAYALMVLAREGAANMGDLRYYADVKADAFSTPLAAAQIGAALAFYGDQTRADMMFARASALMADKWQDAPTNYWRADYGTNLRDTAGLLTLAVEAGSEQIDRNRLSQRISGAGRTLSTQESVWSLMAAHALIQDGRSYDLTVNGVAQDGPLIRALAAETITDPMAIRNEGRDPTQITVTALGVPTYPLTKGGYGYGIERSYFMMDGTPVDPTTVKTGDRFVTVLRISPTSNTGARLMVNDPLPAGFEIDNPNLISSGDIRSLDWLSLAPVQNAEFRSDRFLAAVDWRSAKSFDLAYVVRAISPGIFHHPAATVEDMYRPQYRANTDAGRVVIAE